MVQGDYQPTNYTTKSRTHWSMLNSRRLFPTSLCGVLFFGSVSRPRRLLLLCAPFATHNFVTYTLSHTTLSRTIFHTHTHLLRTVVTNSAVECIGRAQHQPLNDRMNVHWTHTHTHIYIYMLSPPPTTPLNPPSASLCLTCVCTEPRWSHQRVDPAAAASLLLSWGLMLLWKLPLRTNR